MKYSWVIKNKEGQKQNPHIISVHGVTLAFTEIKMDKLNYYIDVSGKITAVLSKEDNLILKEYMCQACGLVYVETWEDHLMSDVHIENCKIKGIKVTKPIEGDKQNDYCINCGSKVDVYHDDADKRIGIKCPYCGYKAGDTGVGEDGEEEIQKEGSAERV